MNKNRSKEQIIADILSVIAEKPKKTHIMYRANLSYSLLCKYLDILEASGLVEYSTTARIYVLGSKGKDYLKIFRFSLLEIFSKVTSKDEIIKKEVHWKNILLLSEFSFNDN